MNEPIQSPTIAACQADCVARHNPPAEQWTAAIWALKLVAQNPSAKADRDVPDTAKVVEALEAVSSHLARLGEYRAAYSTLVVARALVGRFIARSTPAVASVALAGVRACRYVRTCTAEVAA